MKTIDNRDRLFELDEIYKYKNLIETSDKEVIRQIIFRNDEAKDLYKEFILLVTKEVDHHLNKTEFSVKKNELIGKMKDFLKRS